MSIWQVTLKYTQEGNQARNVLYYTGSGDANPSWEDVLQEFAVAWTGNLADSYSPGTFFTGINVLEVGPGNVSLDYDLVAPGFPGVANDQPNATQIASLVTLIGNLPVKPARGRIYLPAPSREMIDSNGRFTVAHTTRVSEWMSDIVTLTDTEGASFALGIYSRVWPDGGGILFNEVGGYVVKAVPATQRKRRIGQGN